jgi:hypothetical protein
MADGVTLPATGAAVATDETGSGHVQIIKLAISTDGSATLIPAEATNGLDVDVTRVIPGTSATHLGKAEDAAHASGDTGVMALAVRRDTAAASSDTDGDYEPLSTDENGQLRTATVIKDSSDNALSFAAPLVVSVTPTLDTSAYAAGDCMDTTILSFSGAAAVSGGSGHILRMTVIDDDDLGASGDFKVHFFESSVTPATENAAHSLSDGDADEYIGTISTESGTWQDHVNNQTVTVVCSPPIPYKLDSGTTLFGIPVAIDGQTHTASGLEIKLQLLLD